MLMGIREIDDCEEDDDCRGDRERIAGRRGSERQKNRQCGLGTVNSRIKRVEPENGNIGCGADFFVGVLIRRESAT